MNRAFAAPAIGLLISAIAGAQPAAVKTAPRLSERKVQALAHAAHTEEALAAVADDYRSLEDLYRGRADEERLEWIRRSQAPAMGVWAKFPRPVDSARDLYEYDEQKADEMAALSAKYTRMAKDLTPATVTPQSNL